MNLLPIDTGHAGRHPPAADLFRPEWLLSRMARGDATALAELYDATVSRVNGLALRILGDTASAEETVSDVYLQAWRTAGQYDPARGEVLTWLLVICRTRSLDALRARQRVAAYPPEMMESNLTSGADPLDLLATLQRDSRMHALLSSLPALQRQLIALAFFRGQSHQEIAESTRMPLGSVKSHIRRALAVLRNKGGLEDVRA